MIDMIYDSETDQVVFFAEEYRGDADIKCNISIDRETFLQRLIEISSEWGESFDIFPGRFAGESDPEPTELTFLQPPTRDCIHDDGEGDE